MRVRRFAALINAALLIAACATTPLDETLYSDDDLAALVQDALRRDLDLIGTRILVGAVKGTITLDGLVETDKQRQRATYVAQGVKGVRSVINKISLR